MARIRSIKPEFWTDKKIADLPKGTALFFIALWNFADDQGIVETDSRTLSLQVPMYRSQDIQKMVNALWKAGLIKCSPSDGLAFINGWQHQKIDRPRDGKWKGREIKWLDEPIRDSVDDGSSIIRRKDRIGKDKIGEDRIAIRDRTAKVEHLDETRSVWNAFAEAYKRRYQVDPVRNAKVNSAIKQFVSRIGPADAAAVATFFVEHNDSFYVRNMHSFSLALKDAESLRTQWAKGRAITQADVRRFEKTQQTLTLIESIDREGV